MLLCCHRALQLRESVLFAALHHLYTVLEQIGEESPELQRCIAGLLFMLQKYEPTPGRLYGATELIARLFGLDTVMTRDSLLHYEARVLEILDFRVETVTPHDPLYLLAQCADFSQANACLA